MAASPQHILVIGSLNADLTLRMPRAPEAGETVFGSSLTRYPGGKGGNQACAAARLSQGLSPAVTVALIGQVGDDDYGPWLKQSVADSGIDSAGVMTHKGPSGVAVISVDSSGQNRIVVLPGANGAFSPGSLSAQTARIAQATILLMQLEIPLPTVLTAARVGREKGAVLILDPAPAQPVPDSLLRLCDFITPNQTELLSLIGKRANGSDLSLGDLRAAGQQVLARGARNVVIKRGSEGALWLSATAEKVWPAPAVTAVDTTAAGDTWNGAFAAFLAEGRTIDDAGRFACVAASLSVTKPGAQPSIPHRSEVKC